MLKLLFSKRKHIIIISIAGAVVAAIASLIVTPKYKSTAFIYPVNIEKYSMESQTEQLMQFITAAEIREQLLEKFHLAKHYELDSLDPHFASYYTYSFEENVKISQTKYESIQIEVLDKDPVMAQQLVYGVVDAVNNHIRNGLNSKTLEFVEMHKTYTASKKKRMDSLENIFISMSKEYAALDFFSQMMPKNANVQLNGGSLLQHLKQAEEATTKTYNILPGGKPAKLNDALAVLGKKGIIFSDLMEQYKGDMAYFNESRQEMDKGIRDITKKFTYVTYAQEPNLPDTKAFPKRTIMVAVGGISAFLFGCLFFIVMDRYKRIKEQLV